MFAKLRGEGKWSQVALRYLTLSIVMCVLLSILDGILRGPLETTVVMSPFFKATIFWVSDFRQLFDQGLYASTVFFVGAKFFETRTVMTVGFDRIDGGKVSVKGPDDDNIVWIGRRYDSPHEAQVVATVIGDQITASANAD